MACDPSPRNDAIIPLVGKKQTTLTLDEDVLAALKARSDRTGLSVDEWVEHLLRKELGFELLDRLQQRNNLSEAEAMVLALEAQRDVRQTRGHGLEEAYQAAWEEIGDTPGNTDDSLTD